MSPNRSSISSEAGEAVLHYKRKLTRHLNDETPDIVLHCLDKLDGIPVNIAILQETGIGKIVNHLKKSETADESVIERAREIVLKWKEVVAHEEELMNRENDNEDEVDGASGDDGDVDSDGDDTKVRDAQQPSMTQTVTPQQDHHHQPSSDKASHRQKSSSSGRHHTTSVPELRLPDRHESDNHVSSHKKKKKDKEREKEKDRSTSSSSNGEKSNSKSKSQDRVKKEESSVSSKSKKRKHRDDDSAASGDESDSGKPRKRRDESSQKSKNHSADSSSKTSSSKHSSSKQKSSSSSSGKHAKDNGFEAALLATNSDAKKESSKSSKNTSSSSPLKTSNKPAAEETAKKYSGSASLAVAEVKPMPKVIQPPATGSPMTSLIVPSRPSNNYSHITDGKTDDEALSALISMSKNAKRTAIYSGKKSVGNGKIPKLSELCVLKLQENVDSIVDTRCLNYKVLEPILIRAKPETLINIENNNSYLTESTGELWKRICQRHFPKEVRQEFEAWREMYERCMEARQKKLDFLTDRVNKSYKNVNENARKTKLAYVEGVARAPRNIQRVQDKNGTGPSASGSSLYPKKVTAPSTSSSSSMAADSASSRSVPAVHAGASGGGGSSANKKPKVAPMMAKTLRMVRGLKVNFRR